MSSSANNVVINPTNVLWQIEFNHQFDMAGLAAVDLDAKYFLLNSAKDLVEYYVWFDLDASSVDPAPAGKTGIEVDVATGDSPAVMAAAAVAAIDALGDFDSVVVDSTKIDVKGAVVGEVTDSVDVDSNVVVNICRRGKDLDLGLLEGDVELNVAPSNFDLQSHQTGVTILSKLFQGFETVEATTVLQETTKSNLKEIYKIYGGAFTPGAGTEVFGGGTGIIGKNMLIDAAVLRFVPVNDLGSELSYEANFMLALPVPDTLTFSGENPRTLSVTWGGFPDLSKDSRVDTILFGDATQDGI